MLLWARMSGVYLRVYNVLPEALKKRINPLDYAIDDFVRGAASREPGGLVLDAGAGESRFAGHFAGHRYVAVDSCVGDAAWDYSKVSLLADLVSIPLADGVFDTVLNIQVLEHVPDPQAVVCELFRVLKPGGRLYLTAPQGWHEHQSPNDYFRFTKYALRKLVENAGFADVGIEPLGGYFHYLGHRLTYVPKSLFPGLPWPARVLLAPLEIVTLSTCCFCLPILCYYLDRFDRSREFKLCYRCVAVKPLTDLPAGEGLAPLAPCA